MRNLKRALSLALASVMLLGMMVVGTSAASYPDVDENDNVEAIEVLNAVNVMIGRQGNFEPDEAVNRHEMAVIMAKLVLGVDTADNYVGSHPFTDVVPWADKYVAACYENGLVAGTSATTYGGGNPLTAVQAAAMMLRALGYKDLSVGAQDWRAPVTAMANQIRLFNGVASNPSERLNRNQVAQLALNTLKSPIVNLKDNTISWSNDEGQVIMTGGSREYIVLSSREAYARAINRVESAGTSASQIGGWTVELGEHLYNGKLQLRDTTDVFGRPARHWEYDGKVIGDYAKEELLVKDYVGKVTGKDLYDLLTSDVLDDYELIVHVDGVDEPKIVDAVKADPNRNTSIVFDKVDLNRNNKAAVGATGTGVQTEVYVDHIEHEIYVAVINTYLAIADKDYDTKKEETALTIYGVAQETASKEYVKLKGDKESYKLGVEEFAIAEDMAKNDSFLVTLADQEIQTIVPAEVVSGATLSAFKLGDHVVSGGTDYNYTTTATYNAGDLDQYTGDGKENLKDRTYDIYLDAYGNLIGLKEIESKKNYVFISGLDRNGSNLVNRIATANAVFLDGTSETIQINMTKSTWNDVVYTDQNTEGEALLNTWCTYTKNGDIYTVKEVFSAGSSTNLTGAKAATSQFHQTGTTTGREADKEFEINLKNLRLDGGGTAADGFRYVYGDSDSVYLTSELEELRWTDGNGNIAIVTGAETVSTGIIDTSITVWDIKGAADTAEDSKVKGEIPYKANNVAHGVYTLYDKDGIIIAAMAVGEGSAAKDLVYVHSDSLDLESDNGNSSRAAGDGLWTWSRRVIRDGQEVTLTEVGDASEELEFMEQYKWYEVREDGNGDVIKVTRADIALGTTGRDRFVEDYTKINDTVELDNVSTVLYHTEGGPNANQNDGFGVTKDETLVVKGNNTLAVNTKEGSGIHFRNDVNVVLQYWNRNTKEIDIMAGEGVDDLKDMVDIVNDITENNDRYNDGVKKTYYVSALIENGLATDIVIFDSYNTYSVNRPVTPTGNARLVWNDVNKDDQYWNLIIPASEYKANMTTAEIAGWLAQAGCSEISKTRVGWNFVRDGITCTDQAIVVIPSATYNVVVSAGANGTASANVTYAEAGDKITVTTAPAAGYVVDKVTTTPATTVTGSGNTYTFTMPAASVVVYVTFKSTVAPGEVTVTVPTGRANVLVNNVKVETVRVGDVISLDPAEALMATGGVVDNGNGTYTVTGDFSIVAKNSSYTWNTFFSQWFKTNPDGTFSLVAPVNQWTVTSMAASAKRFSLARAGKASGDRNPIDTTNPNWFFAYINDPTKTFEVDVTITRADGTTTTVTFTGSVKNAVLTLAAAPGTPAADVAQAFAAMGTEGSNTGAFEPDTTPAVESDKVVIENNAGTMTLYVYDPENNKATEAEIKGAIIKALKATKPNLTAEDIVIEGTKVTIGTDTYSLNQDAVEPLYKVTVGKNTQYVKEGGEYTGLAKTVNYVMPATKRVDTDATSVTNGKFTFTRPDATKVDFEYAVALSVDGMVKDSDGAGAAGYTVWYDTGKTAVNEKWAKLKDTTTYTFIRAGVGIYVTASNLVEGTTLRVTINGQDYTATVQSDKTANIQIANGFTAYGKDADGNDLTKIDFVTKGAGYTVYWDGVVVGGAGKQWEPGKEIPLTGITFDSKATYILGRVNTGAFGKISEFPGGKALTFTAKDVKTAGVDFKDPQVKKDLEKGIIRIYAAYEVKSDDDVYTVSDTKKADDPDHLTINTTYKYVAKGTKLNVTAYEVQTLLKPNTTSNTKSEWTEAEMTLTTSPAAAKDGKAVYEVTLNKAISATEFVEGQKVSGTVGSFVLAMSGSKVNWSSDSWGNAYKVNSDSAYKIALDTSVVKPVAGKTDNVVVTWDDTKTVDVLYKNMTAIATITEDTDKEAVPAVDGTIKVTLSAKKGTEIDLTGKSGTVGVLKVTVNGKLFYTIDVKIGE